MVPPAVQGGSIPPGSTMNAKEIEALKAKLRARKQRAANGPPALSTGSTLLDLALTGRPGAGFAPGCYYLLVGDSASGKTFLALTALAEAACSPAFAKHRLIYNAPERGARMDVTRFFGKTLAGRLETPDPSPTVEEFYY